MHNDKTSRTLAITIKAGRAGLSKEKAAELSRQIATLVGDAGYSIQVQEVVGGGELYIGTRPNKRDRLEAVQSMPANMTAPEIAASLGLSARQVHRYRALLKALGSD